MRFKLKTPIAKDLGDIRVRRKFLWLPKSFDGREARWLEFANIIEQVTHHPGGLLEGSSYDWVPIGFQGDK